ncbi:MAG: hypothetical protein H7A24_17750 [Leptospiraceae bacterium]|nr:hypothetical protein [Leptospiraceae bacterium]MCP5513739.1 hypothetical protein [Leptospiraceae bacterium]
MKYLIYVLILALTFCASGFKKKKLLIRDQRIAIYSLEKNQIRNNKYIEGKFIHPYTISAEKLTDIFGNLRFTKTTRINTFSDYIFHQEELGEGLEDVAQALENIDDTQVLVVLKITDHLKSVLSNFKRTTYFLWVDEFGLNIVFSEIQEDLAKEKGLNFYDWTQVDEIKLDFKPDENQIAKEDYFTYKKVKGFNNRKWLIFSLEDLDRYRYKERAFSNSSSNNNDE